MKNDTRATWASITLWAGRAISLVFFGFGCFGLIYGGQFSVKSMVFIIATGSLLSLISSWWRVWLGALFMWLLEIFLVARTASATVSILGIDPEVSLIIGASFIGGLLFLASWLLRRKSQQRPGEARAVAPGTPAKIAVIALSGVFIISATAVIASTLKANSYVTNDGVYGAEISERWVLLDFTSRDTLVVHTNPGQERYQYKVKDGSITLTNASSGETNVYSFQYIADDMIIVMDGVEYHFMAEEA